MNHISNSLNFPVLVIGGGISGITAAVELAEAGQEVVLVEKAPYLGGNVSTFDSYFPKMCPPSCGLEINYRRIRSNPRIACYTGSEVQEISGHEGDFTVTVAVSPRLINDRCTACGKCAEVCPVERKRRLGSDPGEKAAYLPGGLAFPLKYTIEEAICEKQACGKCLSVCEYDAIDLAAEREEMELRIRRIIVATGWHPYDAARIGNYRYSEEPDVVTNLEFEHLLAACTRNHRTLERPSDGSHPRRIAFIQCAGSRDHNHLPYCSSVCCSASLKHALTLAERYPGIETEVFYIDLRLSGRNEKLLNKARATPGLKLTKGKVGRIRPGEDGSGLVLEVEDIMSGTKRMDPFDMVVLATGLVPNQISVHLTASGHGFYESGTLPGMIPASACKRPMDVASSVRDATAAALKAMQS